MTIKSVLIASAAALALALPMAGIASTTAFAGPVAAAPVATKASVVMTAPADPKAPIVLEITGLKPGEKVGAVTGPARRVNQAQPEALASGKADSKGRVKLTLRHEEAWRVNEKYGVYLQQDGQSEATWTGYFTVKTTKATKTTKPAKPAKKSSGLAKTGV